MTLYLNDASQVIHMDSSTFQMKTKCFTQFVSSIALTKCWGCKYSRFSLSNECDLFWFILIYFDAYYIDVIFKELSQDKEALQNKVCKQLKQISQLRSQVNDLNLVVDQAPVSELADLRQQLELEQDALERKEKEV